MSICPSVRSPTDEEGVHDSFHQLIAEQTQNGGMAEAFELQQLQRELEEEGRGNLSLRTSRAGQYRNIITKISKISGLWDIIYYIL